MQCGEGCDRRSMECPWNWISNPDETLIWVPENDREFTAQDHVEIRKAGFEGSHPI